MKKYSALLLTLALLGCGEAPQAIKNITASEIQAVDPAISGVELHQQTDGRMRIDIQYQDDPATGGGVEWNSIATTNAQLAKLILTHPNASKLNIFFNSPANKNAQWAQIRLDKDKLSPDWQQVTYHQLFAQSEPIASSIETSNWLCTYYTSYESSRPSGQMPPFCNA
ncbi:hypothetical protein HQN60_00150 [Deefgea piscis]|uniref:Uncharacterized protein n=1 Tax=Deefgea piscis TaxID=2739061 RepID=A0A6M8SPX3_9NEIS|nr:hypothetical protein [Deefgea piscis]QKJ65276.1 hypothetical protein HQN60_00150 [Deefgea piscis]